MIGIKLNNVFLDLKPGTSAEVERKSPFFAIGDVTSEASTPIEILYTEKNAVAMGFIFQYYTVRKKKKYTVELYDDTVFKSRATLVVEGSDHNLNRVDDTSMTGYVLFGLSDFFSAIKDKTLTQLSMGGVRSFTWTTNDPTDSSGGFWQHIHDSWTDATIPYVFAPVRNEEYTSLIDWMNKLGDDGKLFYDSNNPLVPLVSVQYVFERIFFEHGWTVDFTGINDAQWHKLLLVNTKEVDWYNNTWTYDFGTGYSYSFAPKPDIQILLNQHLPDKTISDFLIQHFTRYGIAPVFNLQSKKCRFVAVKELGKTSSTKRDWTMYAEPNLKSIFTEDRKIFAFQNEIDGNDAYPQSPDFEDKKVTVQVYKYSFLTTPNPDDEGKIAYCWWENQFYKVVLDETSNLYEWKYLADNIFNEEPDKYTDAISTSISTLPVQFSQYATVSGTDRYGFFPIMNHGKGKSFGYRTLIYHGMVYDMTDGGTLGVSPLRQYPYASSLCIALFEPGTPSNTIRLGEWSNVFRHINMEAGLVGGSLGWVEVDYGIIKYWWESFLNILQAGEDEELKIWLPKQELAAFEWDDVIYIQNIPFLVKTMLEPMSYRGNVLATLRRLLPASAMVAEPDPNHVDVYAKLVIEDVHGEADGYGYSGLENITVCDVRINLYSDAAGTIPYTPGAAGVAVVVNVNFYVNTVLQWVSASAPYTMVANTHKFYNDVIKTGTVQAGQPGAGDAWENIYELAPSADYIII